MLSCVRCSRTGKLQLWWCTHIHTTPRHPFLPITNPIPSLPLPSHLPGPIPSIKLQKQVSQQPGRGEVSVCLLPAPTPPVPALPAPLPTPAQECIHFCCTGLHRDVAHEGDQSRQPAIHMSAPAPQASPPCPNPFHRSLATPELGSLSGCQGRFGIGLCSLKLTLPSPTPG